MSRMKKLKASMTQFPDIDPPSMWLLAFEHRALWEFWAGVATFKPLQLVAPRGDGHPVLVIPVWALQTRLQPCCASFWMTWVMSPTRGAWDATRA